MPKIIVTTNENPFSDAKRDALIKRVADSLGVLAEDVVLLPTGTTASVIDVPGDLTKAREKKDAHDAAEKEKAEKEQAKAEAEGAEDLDTKTVADLHEIARTESINLHGATTKDDILKAIRKARKR